MTDEHLPQFHFFVDATKYESAKSHLSGLEIKTISGVDGSYQLYLEEEGEKPDLAVSDGTTVSLQDRIKHFFAVPPATFGRHH